jgi:CBS domain-containing protein
MAEKDIGSLVVMEHGDLVGMLTFPRGDPGHGANGGSVGTMLVRSVMDDAPADLHARDRHRRGAPHDAGPPRALHAGDGPRTLMGVISFYDVAKAVVDSQDFENRMLKAYIRDWPEEKTTP